MSHQTGIHANADLKDFLVKARNGAVRLMKIVIKSEHLVLGAYREVSQSWDQDYDACVLPILDTLEPCYILYRLDSHNLQGFEWLFISWSPDQSPVRLKMVYAATRATVKKEFGGNHLKDELFGTVKEDICFQGYLQHLSSSSPAPLTTAEQQLHQIKITEDERRRVSPASGRAKTEISMEGKNPTLQGLAFPLQEEAKHALQQLKHKRINYLQLRVDTKRETIELVHTTPTETRELPSRIPTDCPRYHFFVYKHAHQGQATEAIVFIYSMPGYSCSIKERMLYSSCKNRLLDEVERDYHIEIAKKMEIDSGEGLTDDFLYEEVYPKQHALKQAFTKPKGPTVKRGNKRLIRGAGDKDDS
ncbi:twinfilin-2b [Triplophysa dalaica]|uniref:twinfilin-2b n=1 Tax=Triplophysa dalaica TaxID=1582913 RepID=UPI0024DF5BA3|nr:twinfilin-2b [Triplophysa dalaica]